MLRRLRRLKNQFRRMFDIDSWAASRRLSAYNRQLRRARQKSSALPVETASRRGSDY